jgi:DNA-directed RNA polymerase sigma subunit (sigma70/sigma32)
MRKHVLGWLASIAENLAKDALADSGADDCHLEQEHWQNVPDQPVPVESAATRRVRELMDSVLTERERFVLRAKFQWYQPGNDHQRLPNEVAAGLASKLNTTPENVRQIASRAFRKLKEAILRSTDGSPFSGQDVV